MLITVKTKVKKANDWVIIRLPKEASLKLSTRGFLMVAGTINNHKFISELEPDGVDSHWFRVDTQTMKEVGIKVGDSVILKFEQIDDWPDPTIPQDLKQALDSSPKAKKLWKEITARAKWEWVRWIRSTKNIDTRKKRIMVGISKLNMGKRRPCCFNSRQCTVPEVSYKGILVVTDN